MYIWSCWSFLVEKKILFIDVSVPTVLHVHELILKHNHMQVSKLCIGIASLLWCAYIIYGKKLRISPTKVWIHKHGCKTQTQLDK